MKSTHIQFAWGFTALEIEAVESHPNKMKFRGVLVRLDEPSTKPPGGARGHRILVPTEVAEKRLGTLKGMGLNYSPDLDTHAQRHKVGVIEKAWIDGKDLRVEGHIWKHDFPEAEKDLKQHGLGMSMELGQVAVEDPHADIWTLADFNFLGATILWRDAAAYYRTQAIAAKAEQRRGTMKKVAKKTPAKKTAEERIAAIAAQAAAGVVKDVLAESNKAIVGSLSRQTKILSGIGAQQEKLAELIASRSEEEDEEEVDAAGEDAEVDDLETEDEDNYEAAGKKKKKAKAEDDEEEQDDEDEENDEGDEEVDAEVDTGDLEEEDDDDEDGSKPGHNNEDSENQGDKTSVSDKTGPQVKAMREQIKKLENKLAAANDANRRLSSKVKRYGKQVEAASAQISRRSLTPEVISLLQKSNIDANDLFRTQTKLNVGEIDSIIANWVSASGVALKAEDRIALKNQFLRAGLMDDGRVDRSTR